MTNRFIWYELLTPNRDAAVAFYGAVVGWTASDGTPPGMDGFRYTILSAAGRGMGGVVELTPAMQAGGARPGWLGYVEVAEVDACAEAVAAAGGRLLMAPADIPEVGRFAMVADPGGAPFYLLEALPRDDAPPPAAPGTPAMVSWHELYAGQGQEAAFAFYAALFGWETMDILDMGAMGSYRIFGAGGERLGGMMDKPPQLPVPSWTYYFEVEAIDSAVERIAAHGGSTVMGPHEVPGGGWIVQALDPQGASFALSANTR